MEDRLQIDILNRRMKILYQEVKDAIGEAQDAYIANNMVKMNAFLQLASVKSNLLIAERIDMATRILNAKNV